MSSLLRATALALVLASAMPVMAQDPPKPPKDELRKLRDRAGELEEELAMRTRQLEEKRRAAEAALALEERALDGLRAKLAAAQEAAAAEVRRVERDRIREIYARHAPDDLVRRLVLALEHADARTRDEAAGHLARLGRFALPELERQSQLASRADVIERIAELARGIRAAGADSLIAPARGGSVLSVSEEYGGAWRAASLTDGALASAWCNRTAGNLRCTIDVALGGAVAQDVHAIGISGANSSHPRGGVKDFELYASAAAEGEAWVLVGKLEAPASNPAEPAIARITVPPFSARRIRIVTLTNHGDPGYVLIGELEVYGTTGVPEDKVFETARAFADRSLEGR